MAKKIMFCDKYGLTQAVLEGRKTQTRRLILPQPYYDKDKGMVWKGYMYGIKGYNAPHDAYDNFISTLKDFNRLPYNIGEEVAVAQSMKTLYDNKKIFFESRKALLQAKREACWNNKMFIRASILPHRIKITNVRVERLQDISDEDCLKEGIGRRGDTPLEFFVYGEDDVLHDTPQRAFASLIDKTCGKGTWDSNPWVFVYDFELKKNQK